MSERFPEPEKTSCRCCSFVTFGVVVGAAARILSADGLDAFGTATGCAVVRLGSPYPCFPGEGVAEAEIIPAEELTCERPA